MTLRTAPADLDDMTLIRTQGAFLFLFSDLNNEVLKCRKFGMCRGAGIPIPSQRPLLFIFDMSFSFLGFLFLLCIFLYTVA